MRPIKGNSYVISIGATAIVSPVVWLVWYLAEPLFPILVVWLIIHPMVKIWKELEL
jgi:hypothetical protein